MIRFIKFLKGYLILRVWGYSPERFMNLCSNRGILLWDIENHGDYYRMCVSVNGFFRLKSCLRKTKTKAAIEKKCGLPFFVPKIKRRKFFGIGLCFCLLFLFGMSQFLWAIEITGNYQVTDDVLLDFINENGVHYGIYRKQIDIESLEKAIREHYDEVTWTSAKLMGTKLLVQIKENEYPKDNQMAEVTTEYEQSDLIADRDGVIVGIVTRAGVPQKTVNETVAKGDIIVSGCVPIYNDDATIRRYEYVNADADIYIQSEYPVKEVLPADYQIKSYTSRQKKEHFIQLLSKEYKLPVRVGFLKSDCLVEKNQLQILPNLYLPVFYGNYNYREYVLLEKRYADEEAAAILKERLSKIIQTFNEKGVQIIEKNVKIEKDYKNYLLTGSFVIVERCEIRAETEIYHDGDGT